MLDWTRDTMAVDVALLGSSSKQPPTGTTRVQASSRSRQLLPILIGATRRNLGVGQAVIEFWTVMRQVQTVAGGAVPTPCAGHSSRRTALNSSVRRSGAALNELNAQ
jgi:hypothetical protein